MGCRPSTPEVVPSPPVISEVPSDPKNHRNSFRPSISSLQIPKGDYNIDQLTESDAARYEFSLVFGGLEEHDQVRGDL